MVTKLEVLRRGMRGSEGVGLGLPAAAVGGWES